MSDPHPSPPHIVIGLVADPSALPRLRAAVEDARAPAGEPVLVQPVADDALEVSVGGELLGMPDWVELDADDRAAAQATRGFVRRCFEAVCTQLDPLYAGVAFEWRIPSPAHLDDEGVWLPGDLYWSTQLEARDREVQPDLEAVFGAASTALANGRLLATGGLLDAGAQAPAHPLAAGERAARRLRSALSPA